MTNIENPLLTTGVEKTAKRETVEAKRRAVLLVTVDNDPESRMIRTLAARAGVETLVSPQAVGATLDREEGIVDKILAVQKGRVWTVEIPGPAIEEELRKRGLTVEIIDHHTYGQLDRVTDSKTGARRRSSLEQFLEKAEISDEELAGWGFDPKTIRGLGIMDDRFVAGLRQEGYSPEEINRVLALREKLALELNPKLEEIIKAAEGDWKQRYEWNGYIVIESTADQDVFGSIGTISIREDADTRPMILSAQSGTKIYIKNIEPTVVEKLMSNEALKASGAQLFTFGAGRCWGVDNTKGEIRQGVALEDVKKALS